MRKMLESIASTKEQLIKEGHKGPFMAWLERYSDNADEQASRVDVTEIGEDYIVINLHQHGCTINDIFIDRKDIQSFQPINWG